MRPPSRCGVSTPMRPWPLPTSVAVGSQVTLGTTGLLCRPLASTQPWGGWYQRGCFREGVALSICFPVPPATLGEEENVSVIVNQPVTLECPVPGVPPQGSRWLKDGNLLTAKLGVQLSAGGTVLQVMFWSIAEDGKGNRAVKTPTSLSPPLGERGCRGEGVSLPAATARHRSQPPH